jgi:O-antigen/teichoic acid export membrane protein
MNLKKRSPFLKNFIALFTGSAVAQLIPIALSPVLARIYSTDDFAVFGIFYSTLLMLSVIAAAKYEVAIVVPKSESESRKVAMVSAIASLFVFVLLAIVSMLFSDAFVDYVDNQKIRPWIPLILIGVLITGLYQSTSYWLIRRAKFKDLAINKVSQRVFEGASNLALGSAKQGFGLIVSDIIGRFFMLIVSVFQIRKDMAKIIKEPKRGIWKMAKRYRQYPLNFAPSSLVNSMGTHLPLIFVSNAYTVAVVGSFNFSKYILTAPIGFIGQNLSQVFLERISQKRRDDKPIFKDLNRLTGFLALTSLTFVLPLMFLGPWLFTFVFGSQWEMAGEFSQILAIAIGIRFVVSPTSGLLLALGKVKLVSIWQWTHFLLVITLVPVSKLNWEIESFLIYFSCIEIVSYILYGGFIYYAAAINDRNLTAVS